MLNALNLPFEERLLVKSSLIKIILTRRFSNINFELFIQIISYHQLIPLIYSILNLKELLSFIPVKLKDFMKKIYKLNENRNKELIKEIEEIKKIFEENKIDHTFLKGSANIYTGLYNNIGERMINDIDILCLKKDLDFVKKILIKNYVLKKTMGFSTSNHLPRFINKKKYLPLKFIINYCIPKNILILTI